MSALLLVILQHFLIPFRDTWMAPMCTCVFCVTLGHLVTDQREDAWPKMKLDIFATVCSSLSSLLEMHKGGSGSLANVQVDLNLHKGQERPIFRFQRLQCKSREKSRVERLKKTRDWEDPVHGGPCVLWRFSHRTRSSSGKRISFTADLRGWIFELRQLTTQTRSCWSTLKSQQKLPRLQETTEQSVVVDCYYGPVISPVK